MISCTRILEFDAAHRVMNHESKCASLHGHRYKVEIEASGNLDTIGRVIDFSSLKALVGEWIDRYWDHTVLIFQDDEQTLQALHSAPGFKPVWVSPFNPTAENMAEFLLREVCPPLLSALGIVVRTVTVWETPNCKAVAKL
jgi:6-pyruvoyltetrahydropterin/6-carboxytetrahydropterin synthase